MSSVNPILLVWRGFLTLIALLMSPILFPVTLLVTCGTILIPIASYEGDKQQVAQAAKQSSVSAFLYGFYIGSTAILNVVRLCFGKRSNSS